MQRKILSTGFITLLASALLPVHAAESFYADMSIAHTLTCSAGTMYATIVASNGGNSARDSRFSAHLPINDGADATITSVTCTSGSCLGLPSPTTDFCRIINAVPNNNGWYITCGDWDISSGNAYDVAMGSSTSITVVVTITDAYDFDSTGYFKMDGNVYSSSPDDIPGNNYDLEQISVSTPGCP